MNREATQPEGKARVLVLTTQYPSEYRAFPAIFIHRTVQALEKRGVAVRVCAPVPWSPRLLWYREKWRIHGMVRHSTSYEGVAVDRPVFAYLPLPVFRHASAYLLGITLALRLKSLRRSFAFDLVHAQGIYPEGLVACVMRRQLRVPVVCSARGSDLNCLPHASRLYYALTRRVLHNCDALVTVSKALGTKAVEIAGAGVRPQLIYNGVDADAFTVRQDKPRLRRKLGLPATGKLLVFVGRCEVAKGCRELLTAFQHVGRTHPDLALVMVGKVTASMQQAASEFGPEQGVHWAGEVLQSRVAEYLNASDVFMLPTYREGMPNALLEAMACGLPCIATGVGGIPEVLDDGQNGLLVPACSSVELTRALERVIQEPCLATRLGERAAATVRAQFSWARNAEQHLELYRSLATHRMSGQSRQEV